jgi:flagellar hook-associated protein 1
MSLGLKAMTANYAALQTIGHNIANANVAGYSRQQAQFATSQGQFSGAGFYGKGVDVVSVTRSHNEFLTRESASAQSLAAMDATRLEQLRGLESVFRPGELGLGHATSQFFGALSDLASNPADSATRQVVMSRAGDMASRFAEAGTALDQLQAGVRTGLDTAVAEVNSLARNIAQVNAKIASLRGLGQPANDVLDERERLVSRLSQHVQVSRVEAEDGSLALFIGGGQRLVLGTDVAELRALQDNSDPSRSAIGIQDGPIARRMDAASLGGGGISGLLRFQNTDLVDGRNLIGQLAVGVGAAVNQQQMRGANLQPPLGTVPSQALFGLGAPQAIAGASNARDAGGNPLSNVTLTLTDAAALQASDYDLRADPSAAPGVYQLTRLRDGLVTSVASGDVVDGMRIDIGPPAPAAGDSFLLQPVARAVAGMTRLLDDPRDLAAASVLVATPSPANQGTASVASLRITAAPLPVAGATANITFTNDSGDYVWDLVDASNTTLASGSGSWQAGQSIPAPPQDINGFALQLAGVPRNGDVMAIAPTSPQNLASNNGNALALLGLRDGALVGGATATNAYAQALADIGVRVQSTRSSSEISGAVAQQAEAARSADAGVNLDEEAARLIQFQQSYQAAAKVLQVAQTLFDTLLQTTAR